jgi:uncharacterized protein (TIGR03067 family)
MMRQFLPAVFVVVTTIASLFISSVADAQSLDGTWEITAVIDNGRVVEPNEVLLNYAADGRVIIRGQQVELLVPSTYQRKRLPFVVDNSASPATFDMAGAEKTGGRGIFMASKDTLLLCLSSRSQGRPTSFASLPGSGNLLVTLRRASNDSSPGPVPTVPSYQDEQLRRMLVGTWGHQDTDSVHYMTLAHSGTATTITKWKDQFKQLFHQEVRSTGKWSVQDGVVTITNDTSTDAERRGQTGSFRVRSITGTELVAVDYDGKVRQEWKAPQ